MSKRDRDVVTEESSDDNLMNTRIVEDLFTRVGGCGCICSCGQKDRVGQGLIVGEARSIGVTGS